MEVNHGILFAAFIPSRCLALAEDQNPIFQIQIPPREICSIRQTNPTMVSEQDHPAPLGVGDANQGFYLIFGEWTSFFGIFREQLDGFRWVGWNQAPAPSRVKDCPQHLDAEIRCTSSLSCFDFCTAESLDL